MSENSSNNESENEAENAEHEAHATPTYDDVNIPVVVLLSILSAIITFVIIAFVQGLYYSWLDSMVREDWNSRTKTPQEQVIADQRSIRDGFYETQSGDIYVSVDTSAKKLIAAKGKLAEPKKTAIENNAKVEKKSSNDPKPVPPGPDSDDENVKKDPAKPDSDEKDPTQNKSKDEPSKESKDEPSKESKDEPSSESKQPENSNNKKEVKKD